jgi:hypothetical protein
MRFKAPLIQAGVPDPAELPKPVVRGNNVMTRKRSVERVDAAFQLLIQRSIRFLTLWRRTI